MCRYPAGLHRFAKPDEAPALPPGVRAGRPSFQGAMKKRPPAPSLGRVHQRWFLGDTECDRLWLLSGESEVVHVKGNACD